MALSTMHRLTMASAKHLLNQGHITPALHASIVKKAKAPRRSMPGLSDRAGDESGGFGSLNPGGGAGHLMSTTQDEV